jgi:hypothetical protein
MTRLRKTDLIKSQSNVYINYNIFITQNGWNGKQSVYQSLAAFDIYFK